MSCLSHNLAFESEEHASENRQYDTQDLQETKCLVEDEVVKGGYDDQGAVNNWVRDTCNADTSCDVRQYDCQRGAQPDDQGSYYVYQWQSRNQQGLSDALDYQRDDSHESAREEEPEADAEGVLCVLHHMLEDQKLAAEGHRGN